MKTFDMPQRSAEWFAIRRGLITASEVGMFVASATTQKAKDARQNLIDKKLGEVADGDDTEPSYESYWMRRGTELEPESMAAYEARTDQTVCQVGFVMHETLPIGCSPDGVHVGGPAGVEGKAVSGKTQISRLRDNVLPPEYLCQIHHSMIVTGAPFWDFWSYHPTLPPLFIRTHRNEFTDQLEAGLREICATLAKEKEWIRQLWNQEMRRAS